MAQEDASESVVPGADCSRIEICNPEKASSTFTASLPVTSGRTENEAFSPGARFARKASESQAGTPGLGRAGGGGFSAGPPDLFASKAFPTFPYCGSSEHGLTGAKHTRGYLVDT